jgi:hypothetical protein
MAPNIAAITNARGLTKPAYMRPQIGFSHRQNPYNIEFNMWI